MIRALMAVILGAAMIAAVIFMPVRIFDWLLIAVVAIGAKEYSRLFFQHGLLRNSCLAAIIVTALLTLYADDMRIFASGSAIVFFVLCLAAMREAKEMANAAVPLANSAMGMIYLGVAFPAWSFVRHLDGGQYLVLLAIVPACLCDTFAYVAGKAFGRRKFAPQVSPNKTMEGYAGALVGALVGSFIVKLTFFPDLHALWVIGLSLVIWVVSPFGDLIESFMKRSIGVKDSGNLIPGHGGILDRLDALIFTAPAAYLYFKMMSF